MLSHKLKHILPLLFVLFGCSDEPSMLTFDGTLKDKITGLPLVGIDVYFCPGTAFGNATVGMYTSELKGTSDECGRYSVSVPADKAKYTSHGTTSDGAVLLFASCKYGHTMHKTSDHSEQINLFLNRPFLDSVKYHFNPTGDVLTISIKTNDRSATTYRVTDEVYLPMQSLEIIRSDETVSIWRDDGSMRQSVFLVSDVPPGVWVSAEVPGIEAGKRYIFTVNGGSGTNGLPDTDCKYDALEAKIALSDTERPTSPILVLPSGGEMCD